MGAEANPYLGLEDIGAFLVPPTPDLLRVLRGKQRLYVARTDHTHDPQSFHARTILGGFQNYFAETRPQDREFHCEGRVLPYVKSLSYAINLFGERGLLSWLSHEYTIPIFSANPEGDGEFRVALEQGHDPDAIMYYLNLRQRVQYNRSVDEYLQTPDSKQHAQKVLRYYTDKYRDFDPNGWRNFSLESAHTKFFGATAMADFNRHFFDTFFAADQTVSYWETDNEIKAVATAWSIQRMQYLLGVLDDRLALGKSPFVSYGWMHGHAWERELAGLGTNWSAEYPQADIDVFLGRNYPTEKHDFGITHMPLKWFEPGYFERPDYKFTHDKLSRLVLQEQMK